MKTLILSILLFSLDLSYGQSIDGHVINSSSENASFVNVYLVNQNDTLKTETDFEGQFSFKELKPDRYNLLVFSIGYIGLDTTLRLTEENLSLKIKILNDSSYWTGSTMSVAFNANRAKKDIKKDTIILLLPGGLITRSVTDKDLAFGKKYNVGFLSRGCIRFNEDNELEYNKVMFRHLDKKYGKIWRKEIRRDVIGL